MNPKQNLTRSKKSVSNIGRWALFIALAIVFLWPICSISTQTEHFEAVRHHDELYILVYRKYYGSSFPLLARVLEVFAGGVLRKNLRTDLIVYHLRRGTLQKYHHKNVGLGHPFVYLNKLHYIGSPDETPEPFIWQWTQKGFERLPVLQANLVNNVVKKMTDYGENSPGWQMFTTNDLCATKPNTLNEKRTPLLLGATKYVLIFRRTPMYTNTGESLSLWGQGLVPAEQSLFSWKQGEHLVSWRTYHDICAGR